MKHKSIMICSEFRYDTAVAPIYIDGKWILIDSLGKDYISTTWRADKTFFIPVNL